jgi:hypothetical protein
MTAPILHGWRPLVQGLTPPSGEEAPHQLQLGTERPRPWGCRSGRPPATTASRVSVRGLRHFPVCWCPYRRVHSDYAPACAVVHPHPVLAFWSSPAILAAWPRWFGRLSERRVWTDCRGHVLLDTGTAMGTSTGFSHACAGYPPYPPCGRLALSGTAARSWRGPDGHGGEGEGDPDHQRRRAGAPRCLVPLASPGRPAAVTGDPGPGLDRASAVARC